MRRLVVVLAVLSAVLHSLAVRADDQFWVSVGSYNSETDAERGRTLAQSRLSESIAIAPANTAAGYFFRVVAGPFSSRDVAKSKMDLAHNAGYSDAWVVGPGGATSLSGATTESGTYFGSESGSSYSYSSDTSYQETDYSDYDYSSDYANSEYPAYSESAGSGLVVDSSAELYELSRADDYRRESESGTATQQPEMVDEAPPGYQLHKLKREE